MAKLHAGFISPDACNARAHAVQISLPLTNYGAAALWHDAEDKNCLIIISFQSLDFTKAFKLTRDMANNIHIIATIKRSINYHAPMHLFFIFATIHLTLHLLALKMLLHDNSLVIISLSESQLRHAFHLFWAIIAPLPPPATASPQKYRHHYHACAAAIWYLRIFSAAYFHFASCHAFLRCHDTALAGH